MSKRRNVTEEEKEEYNVFVAERIHAIFDKAGEEGQADNTFVAFTDGSGNVHSPYKEAAAAYIVIDKSGEIIKKNAKGFLHTTVNRMEMLAIFSAVMSCPDGSCVHVCSDSQYAINAFKFWDNDSRPDENVANHDIINNYLDMKGERNVVFHKVCAHVGLALNEECDAMANEAREEIRKKYNIPIYSYHNVRYE